jgi:hypothetical protein
MTPERHLDEPSVSRNIDLQSVEKSVRQVTAPAGEVLRLGMMYEPQELDDPGQSAALVKLGVIIEPEEVDDPVGESAALKQSLEGLELSLRYVAVFSEDLIELEHPRLFPVHSKERGGGEDRSGENAPYECCGHGGENHGEKGPAMAEDRPPVCAWGRLRIGPSVADGGHLEDVRIGRP